MSNAYFVLIRIMYMWQTKKRVLSSKIICCKLGALASGGVGKAGAS